MFEAIFAFLFKHRPILFANGDFAFGAPLSRSLLVVVGALAAGAVVLTYTRVGGKATARDRAVLLGLRAATLAVLVFCLFRPMLVVSNVVPQQNWVGIVVDDSKSMRVTDVNDRPRSDVVLEHFGAESALLAQLAERFQVRYFRFSGTTDRMNDLSELAFAGGRTMLAPALDRAREDLSHVPVSGLVVVSDGADNSHTAMTDALLSLKASGVPVFTVGVGREQFEKDIELTRVSTPRHALRGSELVVDLMLAQSGYTGQTLEVFVEDNGRIVGTQEVDLPAAGEPMAVRVTFPANEAGVRRFRFRVPTQPGEQVLENNEQEAVIVVDDDRPKILYFEGEPRHEVAFLRRAIRADKNLQVVLLQRTADAKYYRLDVDSAEEVSSGFPKTREELFRYQGLIIGSVEASHFTLEQLRMISDFVSERGGGLLALGGPRAFSEGGYAGTPFAEALPVELESSRMNDSTFYPHLRIRLARAGASHVVTRIAEEAELERKWAAVPELSTFNRITKLKPGATSLLTATGPDVDEQIVLAFQRYGRGLSVALPVSDIWNWQMGMELEDQTHERFWRQLLRWLVSSTPGQVTVTLASDRAEPGQRVRITAGVDDERYSRVNNAKVVAKVVVPAGGEIEVPLEWSVERDGEYHGSFAPQETGLYEVRVEADPGGGRTAVSKPVYLDAAESRSEYFGSQMQKSLLERIADETGGRFYTPATVARLPEDLSVTGKGVTVQEEKDLWDMPILLFLLLGLVGSEWAYRRKRNLA